MGFREDGDHQAEAVAGPAREPDHLAQAHVDRVAALGLEVARAEVERVLRRVDSGVPNTAAAAAFALPSPQSHPLDRVVVRNSKSANCG